ncbi:hypothetical protein BLNAU_12739 [Blattamonas nauphoetae]|uniref:MRG domain-containing protein n=1 Tax=Blattamonas nauphoetae TaxID=2049346 RepID=A0ABQ9XNF8_9EUKA|nr:hypothetical protein BLNAU_12739 [Blattamonas nauphoetae]
MSNANYEVDEKMYGLSKGLYYYGKVLSIADYEGKPLYHVHYHGFGPRYREWLTEDFMLKDTPENKEKAEKMRKGQELKDKLHKHYGTTKLPMDIDSLSTLFQIPEHTSKSYAPIQLDVPHELRSILKNDFDQMTNHSNVATLPCQPTVRHILRGFLVSLDQKTRDECSKLIESLEAYFEMYIGTSLLIQSERPQFELWKHFLLVQERILDIQNQGDSEKRPRLEEPQSPLSVTPVQHEINSAFPYKIETDILGFCDIYGGEHLLRLLIQPFLLCPPTSLVDSTYQNWVETNVNALLSYLSNFRQSIFLMTYSNAESVKNLGKVYVKKAKLFLRQPHEPPDESDNEMKQDETVTILPSVSDEPS